MDKTVFIEMLIEHVELALRLNVKVQIEGFSSLKNEIEDLDNEDFKLGLRMAVYDDTDQALIDEIYSNMIMFEKDEYTRQYKSILKRTIKGMREGLSNYNLIHVLLSYADLTPDEKKEVEYEIIKDDDDDSAQQQEHEKFYVRYVFGSNRHWALAKETAEAELGNEPAGIDFGDSANPVITVLMECPDPHKAGKIIFSCGGIEHTYYNELDIL